MKEFDYPFKDIFSGLYRTLSIRKDKPGLEECHNLEPDGEDYNLHEVVTDFDATIDWGSGVSTELEDVWEDHGGDVWEDDDEDIWKSSSALLNLITNGDFEDWNSTDLVRHWSMNDNTGTTVTENRGSGDDGTFVNTPAWGTGQSGSGIDFDGGVAGTSDYFTVPTQTVDLTSATIAFWAKRDVLATTKDATNNRGSLRIFYGDASLNFLDMRVDGTYFEFLGERTNNNEFWGRIVSNVVADTDWHHFAIVCDNNLFTLYIDGVAAGTDDDTAAGYGSDTFSFTGVGRGYGSAHADYGSCWDGSLDELRLYDEPLTAASVKDLYDYSSGLVDWNFDANVTVEEDTGRSGGSSVKLTATDSTSKVLHRTFDSLIPGVDYSLSFYYKNTASDVLSFYVYDSTHSAYITVPTDTANSTSWSTQQTVDFQVPTGCTAVKLVFYPKSDTDIVWLDNITLVRSE